jgi:hypothetical protein
LYIFSRRGARERTRRAACAAAIAQSAARRRKDDTVDASHLLRNGIALAYWIIERTGLSNAFGHVSARIYGAHPEIAAVVHAHPPGCVCLTQIGEAHRVVHNQGGPFHRRVGEYR